MKVVLKILWWLPVFLVFFISCRQPAQEKYTVKELIAQYLVDSLGKKGIQLDSLSIYKIDTITPKEIVAININYHGQIADYYFDRANKIIADIKTANKKAGEYYRKRSATMLINENETAKEISAEAMNYLDTAAMYIGVKDSLANKVFSDADSISLQYLYVRYKEILSANGSGPTTDSSSLILTPDYKIFSGRLYTNFVILKELRGGI